jgi:enediyne biosynthesis protein E4
MNAGVIPPHFFLFRKTLKYGSLSCLILFSVACTKPKDSFHFSFPSADQTHLDFVNTITESDSVNLLVNEYAYMGGGVGIADFNNDGLPDIFFTGNQVSNRLYINKDNLVFQDITQSAGLISDRWCTGVSIVDINQDGWQDIYVSVAGLVSPSKRKNLLYINQGNLTFTEEAHIYGLDFDGFTTQALFLDYDRDNDLDVYLINHEVGGGNPNDIKKITIGLGEVSSDKLYRNDGLASNGRTLFTDVSKEANVLSVGLGLGGVVSDFNEDGWPDIYITNDYIASDRLLLNTGKGTFENVISKSLGHQSYSSMGVDAADLNNDGASDIVTLDMQPETTERKKMMFNFLSYERYELERRAGYDVQLMRNMLQLNSGNRAIGVPLFREIGQLAGISETDWSWSALAADFDNDGWKDLHITNGMGRDLINADFVQYRADSRSSFTGDPLDRQRILQQKLASMGEIALTNYFYLNEGDLTFKNASEEVGITDKTISNGAAYADLDNDGDLDIVLNNINQRATLMRNESNSVSTKNNRITIKLHGEKGNLDGLGSRIFTYVKGQSILTEQNPVRGYLSTVDNRLLVGLGSEKIDSLIIIWPDQRVQRLYNIASNTTLFLNQKDAKDLKRKSRSKETFFKDVSKKLNIQFVHRDPFFNDYDFQRLLPQKYSQSGPFITSGDVDGDGRTDFFIGGAFKQSGQFFFQQSDGSFISKPLIVGAKYEEDTGCELFDIDGDGDLDLMIASGSNEFDESSKYYLPRAYINEGNRNFVYDKEAIPNHVKTSAQVLSMSDFDKDGDLDVFIGGRVTPLQYPQGPKSFLLRNDRGKFTDVTAQVSPELHQIGMVTGAAWIDIDQDKDMDLVMCGEWMTIEIMENRGGKLKRLPIQDEFQKLYGSWRTMVKADIDNDGDDDLLLGNAGLNHAPEISVDKPALLYHFDFDNNGTKELLPCFYYRDANNKEVLRPAITRNQFIDQMPSIKRKFVDNESYANASVEEIIGKEISSTLSPLRSVETRSGYLENLGLAQFRFHAFPLEAQFSAVNAIVCEDLDGDQMNDIILAGNEFQREVSQGRDDASYGLLMMGISNKKWEVIPYNNSGLLLEGDAKDLAIIRYGHSNKLLLSTINQDSLKTFLIHKKKK